MSNKSRIIENNQDIERLTTLIRSKSKFSVSDTTANTGDVRAGKYFYNSSGEKVEGVLSTYSGATTISPSTSIINIAASGKILENNITINAVDSTIDSNITPGNIKKDVTILGVTGTLESGGGIPEYMSAKNFTFDGNACTGYVGDTSVPQIIIPRSYSYTKSTIELVGSYVNIEEISHRTNKDVKNITLCNEDGSNVHSYSNTDELERHFDLDFGSETNVLIQRFACKYNIFSASTLKTYLSNILLSPVYYDNQLYDASSFANTFIKSSSSSADLYLFGGTIEKTTFHDGEDVPVTTIKGNNNKSGFSSYTGDIIVPASITNFEDNAFNDCINNRILIDKMTNIGQYAFYNCSGINKISLNYASSIGSDAFYRTNIDNLYVPSNIITIPSNAFRSCPLKSLVLENGINKIANYAFQDCNGLTSITIPESLVDVTGYAFYNCNLDSISADINNSTFYAQDNCLINKETKVLTIGTNSSIIPNDVKSIGDVAFLGRIGLTSVILPNTATSIGNSAFYGCSGLTSIIIPNSVISIGEYAFWECSSLTSITISEGVTSIGRGAFSYCSGLTSITIPSSITSIEDYAFANCSSLTTITIKATTPPTLASTSVIPSNVTTINIPAGTLEAYQTATSWSSFASKFVELSE